MAKTPPLPLPVKYYVVDAFTDSAFKGNPAAVCLLEQDKDDEWLQALAAEFKITATCYLTQLHGASNPCFRLRWFSPLTEAKVCGHATLAAAHALFSSGLVDTNDVIEFVTLSGLLTAKRISNLQKGEIFIELDFPADTIVELNFDGTLQISRALKGASIVDIKRTQNVDDLLVEVTSAKNVMEVEPQYDEIVKCPGRGIIVSGIAPPESGFDFYTRFFVPKYGVNEDPVCGSAHCALASYWSKKLGKCDFNAYQASPRGGALKIHLDEQNQRVFLRGKAVTDKFCGHATLAAGHALFSSGLVDTNDVIEFVTNSGLLTAKWIPNFQKGETYIELDLPADTITELNFDGASQISGALKGASIVDIKRTLNVDDILVEVVSAKNVTEIEPQYDEMVKLPGRGLIVSGLAPPESEFDFYTRFFGPKYGVDEDPICGSAHCALASYWSKKLGKCDFNAYQASPRGGVLNIHLDEQNKRVLLRGKAITVMEGCVLV